MTVTAFAGPVISFGASQTDYNAQMGPSLFYCGAGLLDPRTAFAYTPGRSTATGFLGSAAIQTLNYQPYAKGVAAIAAAANVSSGVAMTLVSSSSATTGVAVSQYCINASTGALVSGLLMLDGYTSFTGVVAAGVLTASAVTGSIIPGMTIAGTGVTTGTYILNQLTGPTGGAGTYTVIGSTTVGSTTITGALSSSVTGNKVFRLPFGAGGDGLGGPVSLWNPQALCARAVAVTGSSSSTGGNITVAGYDIYGYPMTETIAAPAGASQVLGKKAFKFIASVTPAFTDAHNYSIDTTDIFGFPLRSDYFGDVLINYASAVITANTGYVAAVTTSPATATTGDVRGTYTVQSGSDHVNRLIFAQTPEITNIGTTDGLFGVAQV